MAQAIWGERIGHEAALRLGCAAAVYDKERTAILITKRSDNALWCLPGGGMDPGESIQEACLREVKEETGLDIKLERLFAVYSTPNRVTKYEDGNIVQHVTLCFDATLLTETVTISAEVSEVYWVRADQLEYFDWFPNHRERVSDSFGSASGTLIR